MFQMLGVFAEFERSMIRERVNAGLARAKGNAWCWGGKWGRRAHPEAPRASSKSADHGHWNERRTANCQRSTLTVNTVNATVGKVAALNRE